jgi:RimJ/RimL family protein N-acetyltransferase
MPGPLFASGERVTLRTIEDDDLEFLQRWRNHPDIRVPLTDSDVRNREQIEEYFEEQISDDGGINLLVCIGDDTESDDTDVERVGEVAIPWIRDTHGTGMLMYWIVPDRQGEGYVTEATELLLEHAFAERRLHKVWAHVIESNPGSQRVLEKLGFEREGRLRESCFIDGAFEDVYSYGLLAEEWQR